MKKSISQKKYIPNRLDFHTILINCMVSNSDNYSNSSAHYLRLRFY